MNDVLNLLQRKQDERLSRIISVIDELKKSAEPEFDVLFISNKIQNKWEDKSWKYQNKNLYFTKPFDMAGNLVTSKTKAENKVAIEGPWAELIRLYTLVQIKKNISSKGTANKLAATIWLAESLSYEPSALFKLKQPTLDDAIPLLEKHFKKRGPFEKYKEIVAFTKKFLVPNKLVIGFSPKTNMKNPALNQVDVTSDEYKMRRDDKYEVDVDKYIGRVKQRFDAERQREKINETLLYTQPKPLYDELRLLAVPFMLAFGLRIGELCRLTDDCLDFDEVIEKWNLKVYTEKGELPSPRPLPRIWQEVVLNAYKRILELTEENRNFSKQVESIGEQAFINALSFKSRPEHIVIALRDAGYDPELHFLRSEIIKDGDIHPSGLTYNKLRGNYESGKIAEFKVKPEMGKNTIQLVYSKKIIASLAMADYEFNRCAVYKENQIDSDDIGSISSSSFSIDLPFSKFLFIAKEDTFDASSNAQGFIPKPLTVKSFTNWITYDKGARNITVFQRYDIRDDDGNIVSINSHQFRHWLTTALMKSGKNEMMIDIYMGRKPGQSRHYDHRTAKERAEAIRNRYLSDNPPDDALGRRIQRMRENEVSYEEIEAALNHTLSVVHFTPWGTCKRDLDVSPCEKGMMCLKGDNGKGCQHFGIDPNDLEAKQSIINTKLHYENQLNALLPNYENLLNTLNKQEPLDQHIQYCIDTINGCEFALTAYEKAAKFSENEINVVRVFIPKEVK
jgi:integrase